MNELDLKMIALSKEMTPDELAALSRYIDKLIARRDVCYNGTKVCDE